MVDRPVLSEPEGVEISKISQFYVQELIPAAGFLPGGDR
jgi:hypothetical protein